MSLRRLFAVAAFLGPVPAAQAQGAPVFSTRPFPAPGVTSFTFQSPSLGLTYDVSAWVPPGFDASRGKKLPVLVVTDGNVAFVPALDATGHIVSGQIRLGAALTSRKYPGLKLASHILEGPGHSDGAAPVLACGLRFLYGSGASASFEIRK